MALLLLLSTMWQLLMMTPDWFTKSYPYLPSTAGERVASPKVTGAVADAPQARGPGPAGSFMIYGAVTFLVAAGLLRRRDA